VAVAPHIRSAPPAKSCGAAQRGDPALSPLQRVHLFPLIAFVAALAAGVATALLLLTARTPPTAPVAPAGSAPATTTAPPAGATSAPASETAPGAPAILPTALPLTLVATLVRDDPGLSLATLEDADYGIRSLLAPGQSLPKRPGVTLARVERARVLIDNAGVLESLTMVRDDAPRETAPALDDAARAERRALSRRIRALTESGLGDARSAPGGARTGLLAEGKVAAVYGDDGELLGVRIDAIREGGLYDRVGLENGDVLTAVNGVSLGESGAAAGVVSELMLSDEMHFSVTKPDGSLETLSLPSAELREMLGDLDAQVFGSSPGGATE
jgi:type II secretory pathway component PulC